MYQKRFGVKLSSASKIRKTPDFLALPKQLKKFEKDSIFQILRNFSFLQLKTASLAYNWNAYRQNFWKHRYNQYRL